MAIQRQRPINRTLCTAPLVEGRPLLIAISSVRSLRDAVSGAAVSRSQPSGAESPSPKCCAISSLANFLPISGAPHE